MQSVRFLDTLVDGHVGDGSTAGAYGLPACTAPAGHMPPPHVREREAEPLADAIAAT